VPALEGNIAWVTGAGSGIGEAAALMLAEEGAAECLSEALAVSALAPICGHAYLLVEKSATLVERRKFIAPNPCRPSLLP
jgi:NAD(P)-dependent dehydrogenase (short-subunit alcohol dehydrogenase family)